MEDRSFCCASLGRVSAEGIQAKSVTEVKLQHEDMDITSASTEVPGDSVLVASPNRIVVSAYGVYLEATRGAGSASLLRTSAHR